LCLAEFGIRQLEPPAWSDAHIETSMAAFVTESFALDAVYARALLKPPQES
jgi:hypothetical protein